MHEGLRLTIDAYIASTSGTVTEIGWVEFNDWVRFCQGDLITTSANLNKLGSQRKQKDEAVSD
jgi:hypothetical protein